MGFPWSTSNSGQRLVLTAAFAAVAIVPCIADTITFSDGTFNLANYTSTTYTQNTGAAGANATFSVTQSLGSGNPAPSLDFNVSWTNNTTFSVFDGLINSGFSYNPAAGAISGIKFSLDRNVTFNDSIVFFANASAGALIEQNNKFYLDSITGPSFSEGTWETISATGLTAGDFSLYDFSTNTLDSTQHPDFSTAGGVITFGLRTGLGHVNTNGTGDFDGLSDNLNYTLTTTPEPSSVWLEITSVAALALWRWRRSQIARISPEHTTGNDSQS